MTDASEWTGPVGDIWAREWRRTDRSFAGLAPQLNAAILARAGDAMTIVDIGCGAGATSLAIAAALPEVRITGIDISLGLIAVATERGADHPNLGFVAGDVQVEVARSAPVNLFVSRHGVMFFADPVAAFTSLRAAAAPGAWLVFSCFRPPALNSWAAELAVAVHGAPPPPPAGYTPGPFAFADPAFVAATLSAAGWTGTCAPADFTYRAGGGPDPVADAADFFQHVGPAAPVLRAAAPDARAAMIERITAVAGRHRVGETVDFPAAAWLWSARAI